MSRALRENILLTVVAGLMICASTGAGTAQAAAVSHASDPVAPFGCRASVLRLDLGSSPVEPTVANDGSYPCRTVSAGVATVSVPNGNSGALLAGPVGAFTYSTGSAGGATAPGAAAVASVKGVTIPTANGTVTVVGPAEADVSYACVNDQTVASAQSTLDVVYVNGKPDQLPSPGAPTTIPLGGGAYIAVNEKIQTVTSLTERVLDIHLANGTDIVLGEAMVTQTGPNACTGTSGAPPVLEICPPGSTLNPVAQECVIVYQGQTIVVSRPFKGPSGGTVVALGLARKKYKSPCLSGPGPKYVLVATKRGGRVTGTPYSDRILARGAYERVTGLGGNDCIDGTGGHQHIYDGNGKDRDYASAGFNRIAVGNGNDYVNGRNGSDWITAGNGNDTVYGGRGNSRIDLGLGHDHVYGGPGRNRIWTGAMRTWVSCGTGKHNTAFVRMGAANYAKAHGCQHIHLLR